MEKFSFQESVPTEQEAEQKEPRGGEKLRLLWKKVHELDEQYQSEPQHEKKANLYSQWEAARKEYFEFEQNLDYDSATSKKEGLKNLLELLNKARQSSVEHEDVYWHVFGKGATGSAEYPSSWINRPDLIEKFAVGKSKPYKSTRDASHDLIEHLAKEIEGELKKGTTIVDEIDPPRPVVSPENPVIPPQEPGGTTKTPGFVPPVETSREPNKPKRVTVVEAKDSADLMARERGIKILNNKLNKGSWLKRKWTQMWEQAYRQMLIKEERKKIQGLENKPGWIKRMVGARTFEATGKKNLFAEESAGETESKLELASLVERFSQDYIRSADGEQKKQLEDPEFSGRINDLVHEYATGGMSDAEFENRKESLVSEIAEKYPDVFARDGLTADNFLEAAKDFRKIFEHNRGLARTEVSLEIDLGLAKRAIKTEANLNWVDKAVSLSQKHFGGALSPEAIGVAASIGSYFGRKPLYWLGGAGLMGGLLGAMRRNVEQKRDLEMHRIERAMGEKIEDFGPDAKRRQQADSYVYKMKGATDMAEEIYSLSVELEKDPDKSTADKLIRAVADAEARMSLSTTRQRDLISFSGKTVIEKSRLEFMKSISEAKAGLQKSGFLSGEISSTPEYQEFMDSLGAEMDKIDRSERYHRWGQNAKAVAVGAAGGLVVGGLVQYGAAALGDHIPSAHWLRPGGKLTGAEKLNDYLQGTVSTQPAGAGVDQIMGIAGSDGTLKIDGASHLVYDRTTGLWNMFDKSGHGGVLARFNIDPATGHADLVPGSYDPNLISLHETSSVIKTHNGPQNLADWLKSESHEGKFGKNVTNENWHLKGPGFLDNDTPLPKADFNELRLRVGYENGHLKIDASKLQEFLTDGSGKQLSGSVHGGEILNVAEAFQKGEIKIGLVPDADHPSKVLEMILDPKSKSFSSEDGSDLTKFFAPDPKTGQPVLKGNAILGIVHEVGKREDGSSNIEWINAVRGNGKPIDIGSAIEKKTVFHTEINRRVPSEWWGLWAWSFGRKPLEENGAKNKSRDGEIPETKDLPENKHRSWFEIINFKKPEDEGKKTENGKSSKAVVDTRGQKIIGDRKDYKKDYPEKFPLKTPEEIANVLLRQENGTLIPSDHYNRIYAARPAERGEILSEIIRKEREALYMGDMAFSQKQIGEIINVTLEHVNKALDKYGRGGRSDLPDKTKIHVVGMMEFQAQRESSSSNSFGICFANSGEIFINFDLIRQKAQSVNQLVAELKKTIAHEIIHGAAAQNFWMLDAGKEMETVIGRRSGILFTRREIGRAKRNGGRLIINRGRALNEAITEQLSEEIISEIYAGGAGTKPDSPSETYASERDVLKTMQKKFGIPFEAFANAVIARGALRDLAEKIDGLSVSEDGKRKYARPQFMSLFLSVMDYEFRTGALEYVKTKQLLNNEEEVLITTEMKEYFPESLLDGEGGIKKSILEKYSLIDEESERVGKLRKAA